MGSLILIKMIIKQLFVLLKDLIQMIMNQ